MASDPSVLEDAPPEAPAPLDWPLLNRLPAALAESQGAAESCRTLLKQAQAELHARFVEEEPVEALVRARARFTDLLLRTLWPQRLQADLAGRLALIAVGGYGRGELHPYSDIDILVLVPAPLAENERASVEQLVAFLWDIGLEVGHSVRTVAECAEESGGDAGGARPGAHLAGARILRGQSSRAAGAAAEGQRHRLQPGTERQDRSRGAARHPHHRLGREATLRRRI